MSRRSRLGATLDPDAASVSLPFLLVAVGRSAAQVQGSLLQLLEVVCLCGLGDLLVGAPGHLRELEEGESAADWLAALF
jgi:hypothetical protein